MLTKDIALRNKKTESHFLRVSRIQNNIVNVMEWTTVLDRTAAAQ
jgi:hypothetical protein